MRIHIFKYTHCSCAATLKLRFHTDRRNINEFMQYTYMQIYIYIHIQTHMYIHTHTYTRTSLLRCDPPRRASTLTDGIATSSRSRAIYSVWRRDT